MIFGIYTFLVLIFSIVVHEVSHGLAAYKLGDPTAKYEGRLSLNPTKHLDPVGSFLFPLILFILTRGNGPIFGWAKPVPINPHNFKDQRWGQLKTAIAGPLSNILVAFLTGSLIRFSLVPEIFSQYIAIIVIINLSLAFFNLLPIPPLDGSHVLLSFFPEKAYQLKRMFQQYGVILLFLVIYFGMDIISPLTFKTFSFIIGTN